MLVQTSICFTSLASTQVLHEKMKVLINFVQFLVDHPTFLIDCTHNLHPMRDVTPFLLLCFSENTVRQSTKKHTNFIILCFLVNTTYLFR